MILDFIKKEGHAKSSDIAEVLGLSLPRVRVLLSEMSNDGLIKPEGEGRSRVYKP
ncbi:MAG: winged helix-turn-helix transcriptional regulator [Spirochaetales bacterium]|nr:winged helix-turn-helix transcriptional regulator [Spirochaetales bacterium]